MDPLFQQTAPACDFQVSEGHTSLHFLAPITTVSFYTCSSFAVVQNSFLSPCPQIGRALKIFGSLFILCGHYLKSHFHQHQHLA
jgi:hypothetical protein